MNENSRLIGELKQWWKRASSECFFPSICSMLCVCLPWHIPRDLREIERHLSNVKTTQFQHGTLLTVISPQWLACSIPAIDEECTRQGIEFVPARLKQKKPKGSGGQGGRGSSPQRGNTAWEASPSDEDHSDSEDSMSDLYPRQYLHVIRMDHSWDPSIHFQSTQFRKWIFFRKLLIWIKCWKDLSSIWNIMGGGDFNCRFNSIHMLNWLNLKQNRPEPWYK